MRATNRTYYNLKRLHLVFAGAALALLAVTVWALVADGRRPWKDYQRTFRAQIEPASPPGIQQVWLPELTVNYGFGRVARFDRCVTCHRGIDRPAARHGDATLSAGEPPQPHSAHPRLDLFVGPSSPHPMAQFGCTVCHEGQGSATDFTWASHTPNDFDQRERWRHEHGWSRNADWDFPMLAARFAESRCLQCHHEVTDLEPSPRFPDPPAARLLAGYHLVRQLGCFGCHEIKGFGDAGRSIGPDMRLEPAAVGVQPSELPTGAGGTPAPPGTMRQVGPSLRHLAEKVDRSYVTDRTEDPARFVPSTRMPRFYGLHEHLEDHARTEAERLEPVEVRAVAEYLLAVSERIAPLPVPAGVTEPPSAERGKRLFETQGCLACHKHRDFPAGQGTQGPDLSGIGAKYRADSGAKWLVGWIRDPAHYSPRTLMPSPLLDPVPLDPERKRVTDPAADIAEYLVEAKGPGAGGQGPGASKEEGGEKREEGGGIAEAGVDELALLYLRKSLPVEVAERYLREGIPATVAAGLPSDAAVLRGEMTPAKKLLYVGRQSLAKRGCHGCHDIPGFEGAQPIGPALSDWGRKDESLLAFERVNELVGKQRLTTAGTIASDGEFFTQALLTHRREGFLWQKLRAPRSFDFRVAENKTYTERLTMGRFDLNDDQREAIMTFVLGLVGEPPAEKYVSRPGPRRRAMAAGRKVLDQYACTECHTLQMERWTIEYDPAKLSQPPAAADYDFLKPRFSPRQLAASRQVDSRGLARVEVSGMPRLDAVGKPLEDEDDQGKPLYYFTLWKPAAIGGQVWPVGGAELPVSQSQIVARRPPLGGALARLLYPVALAQARAAGSMGAEIEAWGWLPPPLVGEGAKVQPAWLHQYLLQPAAIRPAAVLRMPHFNLSAAEATRLVEYFAAAAGADFPYAAADVSAPRPAARQIARLDDALRIVTDRQTYCAKCHVMGDYSPARETRTILAPNLEDVGRRLQPDYLHRWLAHPQTVLPYTAMPVNFPPSGPPLSKDLAKCTAAEQLDAVADLLVHYDWYMRQRTSVHRLIERRP